MGKRKVFKLSIRLGVVFNRTGCIHTQANFELVNWPL